MFLTFDFHLVLSVLLYHMEADLVVMDFIFIHIDITVTLSFILEMVMQMYTIKKVADMAGVSPRTLRYYEEMTLLTPSRQSSNGYRLYDDNDLLQLQQILLYKRMGLPLTTIRDVLHNPSFDVMKSLQLHKTHLEDEQRRLTTILHTIDNTISAIKGGQSMTGKNTFNGLKETLIQDNETMYGAEARERYGDLVVEQSNQTIRKMSKWQWNRANQLAEEILALLPQAMKDGIASETATTLCTMHQEWIQLYWTHYSREAHLGLCKMYTEDKRFTAYYDKVQSGATAFLFAAMQRFLTQ